MLAASIRTLAHMKKSFDLDVELITAPVKAYTEWFTLTPEQQSAIATANPTLQEIPNWQPSEELLAIATVDDFMTAIESKKLDITHPLTDKGIDRFVSDWSAIIVG